METLFIIRTSLGSDLYGLFYFAAFLVATGIFLFQGIRHQYPIRTWLLMTLFGVLGFIIGNKAITLGISEWSQFVHSGVLHESGRSVLGGILGLSAGILIAQWWLKFNRPVRPTIINLLRIIILRQDLMCIPPPIAPMIRTKLITTHLH